MAGKRYDQNRYKNNSRYSKSKYKSQNKTRLRKIAIAVLVVVMAFAAIVAANTVVPFSDSLPTFKTLFGELKGYFTEVYDKVYPKKVMPVNGEAQVHFIDVGQGNSTLILADEMAVLIDAGEVDKGEVVLNYLQKQGVDKLDYIVASHPHSDHIGGMSTIIDNFPADNIIMLNLKPELIPTTKVFENLVNSITAKNLNVIEAVLGNSYPVGSGNMTILGPSGDFDDLNEMSIAVRFSYGNRAFLTTGDMDKKSELALLETGADVSTDVFLLSHHGSKYGNCEEFLDAVRASYYVAEMGYGNDYHHPHKQTVNRVYNRGGTLFRSDVDGDVVFKTDGTSLVKVEKEK